MLTFKCPPLPPLNAWTRNVVSVVIKSAFAVQDTAFRGWSHYHRPPAGLAPEIRVGTVRRSVEPITRLILTNSERNAHVGHPGRHSPLHVLAYQNRQDSARFLFFSLLYFENLTVHQKGDFRSGQWFLAFGQRV